MYSYSFLHIRQVNHVFTMQRISQKLLRNIHKFLDLIYLELGTPKMKEIRSNMEEVVIQGGIDEQDIRMVNSYPSKVLCMCVCDMN